MDNPNLRDRDRNYTPHQQQQQQTSVPKLLPWMRGGTAASRSAVPTQSSSSKHAPPTYSAQSKQDSSATTWKPITDSANDKQFVESSTKPAPQTSDPSHIPHNGHNGHQDANKTDNQTADKKVENGHKTETTKDDPATPQDQDVGYNPFAKRGGGRLPPQPAQQQPTQQQGPNPAQSNPNATNKPPQAKQSQPNQQDQNRQVNIRISDRLGTKIQIKTKVSNTIFQLKQQIGPKIGRRPEKITLMKGGVALRDAVTVLDSGLSDNVSVDLM